MADRLGNRDDITVLCTSEAHPAESASLVGLGLSAVGGLHPLTISEIWRRALAFAQRAVEPNHLCQIQPFPCRRPGHDRMWVTCSCSSRKPCWDRRIIRGQLKIFCECVKGGSAIMLK